MIWGSRRYHNGTSKPKKTEKNTNRTKASTKNDSNENIGFYDKPKDHSSKSKKNEFLFKESVKKDPPKQFKHNNKFKDNSVRKTYVIRIGRVRSQKNENHGNSYRSETVINSDNNNANCFEPNINAEIIKDSELIATVEGIDIKQKYTDNLINDIDTKENYLGDSKNEHEKNIEIMNVNEKNTEPDFSTDEDYESGSQNEHFEQNISDSINNLILNDDKRESHQIFEEGLTNSRGHIDHSNNDYYLDLNKIMFEDIQRESHFSNIENQFNNDVSENFIDDMLLMNHEDKKIDGDSLYNNDKGIIKANIYDIKDEEVYYMEEEGMQSLEDEIHDIKRGEIHDIKRGEIYHIEEGNVPILEKINIQDRDEDNIHNTTCKEIHDIEQENIWEGKKSNDQNIKDKDMYNLEEDIGGEYVYDVNHYEGKYKSIKDEETGKRTNISRINSLNIARDANRHTNEESINDIHEESNQRIDQEITKKHLNINNTSSSGAIIPENNDGNNAYIFYKNILVSGNQSIYNCINNLVQILKIFLSYKEYLTHESSIYNANPVISVMRPIVDTDWGQIENNIGEYLSDIIDSIIASKEKILEIEIILNSIDSDIVGMDQIFLSEIMIKDLMKLKNTIGMKFEGIKEIKNNYVEMDDTDQCSDRDKVLCGNPIPPLIISHLVNPLVIQNINTNNEFTTELLDLEIKENEDGIQRYQNDNDPLFPKFIDYEEYEEYFSDDVNFLNGETRSGSCDLILSMIPVIGLTDQNIGFINQIEFIDDTYEISYPNPSFKENKKNIPLKAINEDVMNDELANYYQIVFI